MERKEKQRLKKFIRELASIRGRHTELVSVYIPVGYELTKIINHIMQEQGTAVNIKDKGTRKNVIDSLERIIRHLRLFKETPKNGLAVFAGNKAEREGQQDIGVWSIEPPEPLNTRLYRCDQYFVVDLLKDMFEINEVYGLIVVDRREGDIGTLKGTSITRLVHYTSDVPGKTTKGGQCCHFNSFVQLNNGDIAKIKNLHNPLIVKSLNTKKYEMEDSSITDKWDNEKPVYKIITKFPRLEILTSPEHLFYVYNNGIKEKCADELVVRDKLLMPEKINIKGEVQHLKPIFYYNSYFIRKEGRKLLKQLRMGRNLFQSELAKKLKLTQTTVSVIELGKRNVSFHIIKKYCKELGIDHLDFIENYTKPAQNYKLPKKIDETLAQILGYFTGDGDIENTRSTYSERDKETAEYYQEVISKYFNCNTNLRFRKDKNYWELRVQGQPISKFIKNEFPEIKNNRKSLVPSSILKSPNGIVASFLKGLYDAEGFCSARKVTIAMNDELLIRQLQLVLLRFSILSSFLEYDNRNNPHTDNHKFILDITEKKSIIAFDKLIGFNYSEKRKKLKDLISRMSGRSNVRQILFSGKEVKDIMKSLEINTSTRIFKGLSNFFANKGNVSKSNFRKIILKNIDKKLVKELFNKIDIPILPVEVHKIEISSEKVPMSDISVKNQNFIANGILVHNSQQRYARIREGAAKDFFKKVGDAANKQFLEMGGGLKGILIGGPGPTKEIFLDGNFLNNELKKKVIGVKDLGYTGEFGLGELVDKSQDVLMKEEISKEKQIMEKFFTALNKEPDKVAYGEVEVKKALEIGAVDLLLISESFDEDKSEEFEQLAEKNGTKVEYISTETREGVQLRDLGKVGALLRFSMN